MRYEDTHELAFACARYCRNELSQNTRMHARDAFTQVISHPIEMSPTRQSAFKYLIEMLLRVEQ